MENRIPAWKRLGLKLKNAPDTSASAITPNTKPQATVSEPKPRAYVPEIKPQAFVPDTKPQIANSKLPEGNKKFESWKGTKRTFDDDDDLNGVSASGPGSPTKKTKTDEFPNNTNGESKKSKKSKQKRSSDVQPDENEDDILSTQELSERPKKGKKSSKNKETKGLSLESTRSPSGTPQPNGRLKRQKSVTFTPDTKLEDGDSSHRMFKDWAKQQKGEDAEVVASLTPPEKPSAQDPKDLKKPEDKVTKKDKKQAKEERKQDTGSAQNGDEVQPYLVYLQQYHEDRSNWKFNKIRQSDLLKNVFNLWRVPAKYDEAVEVYIAGLRGNAARDRLKQSAQEILDEAPADNANSQTEEAQRKQEQRRRAEKILTVLRITAALVPATPVQPKPMEQPVAPKTAQKPEVKQTSTKATQEKVPAKASRKRRRKQRTDMSSDESSSSSDSDSD